MAFGFDPKLNLAPNVFTPPQYVSTPVSPASAARGFQGIPCIAKTGTRLWVAFYGDDGTGEALGNFGIVKYADSAGAGTWVVDGYVTWPGDGNKRAFDPRLWTDPNGHLWQFWSASGGANDDGKLGIWTAVCESPEALTPAWSTFFMLSPVGVASRPFIVDGKAYIGVDYWVGGSYGGATGKHVYEFDYANRSLGRFISTTPNAGSSKDTFDESSRAQLPNGTVVCTIRTKVDGASWSKSTDGMRTWSPLVNWPATGNAAGSRAAIASTSGGRLALAYNNATDRRNMTLKLSNDGGESFTHSVMLDSRLGTSYPDIEIDGDDIYAVFDFERSGAKIIYVAKVSETEVVAGTSVPTIYVADNA